MPIVKANREAPTIRFTADKSGAWVLGLSRGREDVCRESGGACTCPAASSCSHAHASRLLAPLGHTWEHLPATQSVCPAANQPPCAPPNRPCSRAAGDHHRRPGRQAPAGDGYGGRGANTTLRAPAVHALPSCGAAVQCGSLSARSNPYFIHRPCFTPISLVRPAPFLAHRWRRCCRRRVRTQPRLLRRLRRRWP